MGYFPYSEHLLLVNHLFYIWMEQIQTTHIYNVILVCFFSPNHSDYLELLWNTTNVVVRLSANIIVTINTWNLCVWSWRKSKGWAEGTLCITHMCSISLFPSGRDVVFVVESRTRSLISHLTACPKQMGDSGNWHQRLRHAGVALLLSRDATPPPILSLRLSSAWWCQIHKKGLMHKHIQLRSVQANPGM